jgi:hypothetical protein
MLFLYFGLCSNAFAQEFFFVGEGYSSEAKGTPAEIYHRAFSLGNWQGICAESKFPTKIRVLPNPVQLRVGDRLKLGERSALIVEATDSKGKFLGHVPIMVDIRNPSLSFQGRGDWDYLKAVRQGRAMLRIHTACGDEKRNVIAETMLVVH